MDRIEFFEIPDEYHITLNFSKPRTQKKYRCKVDVSHGNVIREIYDDYDEIIATSLKDLQDLGVISAELHALHEIEVRV